MPLTRAQAVEFIDRRRVIPWAPLRGGVLTGKYTAADLAVPGSDAPAGTRRDHARSSGNADCAGARDRGHGCRGSLANST
ncbi:MULTISPECIES: hypothetical protein [Rhodococcus]|uniref:Uncharacterized protein n=1 Tax=Rhodococcus cerastii TaxID=908616 RepID=A0ABU4CZS4_9NOCA|nr:MULTISPECIES: hypothetical protein [Rhodococcus]KAA0922839.1 hypothetical protein FQ188_19700 [Rhodococcus sp. ANT_H53B]MDV6302970.1 hypothetical protein [Rhodococcus cerastii]MDV7990147.1 hypothetical protein [Rhodococcus sp. IEGM 1374]